MQLLVTLFDISMVPVHKRSLGVNPKVCSFFKTPGVALTGRVKGVPYGIWNKAFRSQEEPFSAAVKPRQPSSGSELSER